MTKKILFSILILLVYSNLFANNFYCFETHHKDGALTQINELLFTKESRGSYIVTFPEYPNDAPEYFTIQNENERFVFLNMIGSIDNLAYSFNIIIDKVDLTFGTASMYSPFDINTMEISYGYCRKLLD